VSRTFTEPIVPAFQVGDCPVLPEGFYGSGEVIPLGHATETIDFGAGCGGSCDLRTINLAGGSIFIEETFSDGSCPGVCGSRGLGQPNSGTLTDTIMCGTGIFTGATGSLTGTSRPQGLRVTSSSQGRSASIVEPRIRVAAHPAITLPHSLRGGISVVAELQNRGLTGSSPAAPVSPSEVGPASRAMTTSVGFML